MCCGQMDMTVLPELIQVWRLASGQPRGLGERLPNGRLTRLLNRVHTHTHLHRFLDSKMKHTPTQTQLTNAVARAPVPYLGPSVCASAVTFCPQTLVP